MSDALSGIRVLDFGRYVAGPYCAALLADMGADVVRVERRAGSEDRFIGPVTDDAGALFLAVNRNKRSVGLDPLSHEGAEVVRRLVRSADVVVANLPTAGLERMGLDWPSVSALNPGLVLTTINAMGEGGPWSDRVGFDGIGQAMSGSTHLSGRPGDPIKGFVPWVDFGTASLAAFATMTALFSRAQTGRGTHVTGSLLQTALSFANYTHVEEALLAVDRGATANRHPLAGPADIVRTSDGYVIVQCVGDPLFRRFASLIDRVDLVDDPRFSTDERRGHNGEELSRMLEAWTAVRTTDEVLDACATASVPAGPVQSPRQVLHNEHIHQLGFLQLMAYPGLNAPAPLTRAPVEVSGTDPSIARRPPTIGEHTVDVLAEVGYTSAEIDRLRASGVI